jgi:hypothetical protein
MSKKGARSSGGAKGRQRNKDQATAAHLPPSPATWNRRPKEWPYHMNKGTRHVKPGQKQNRDA